MDTKTDRSTDRPATAIEASLKNEQQMKELSVAQKKWRDTPQDRESVPHDGTNQKGNKDRRERIGRSL